MSTVAVAMSTVSFVYLWRRKRAVRRQPDLDPCCSNVLVYRADDAGYKELGKLVTHENLDMYVVAGGETAIILGPDIFGLSTALKKNADMLAESTGATVILPDHFRGHWAGDLPHEKGMVAPELVKALIDKWGQHTTACADLCEIVVPYLKSMGVRKKIHYLGFCWGGQIALTLASDPELSKILTSAAAIHASIGQRMGNAWVLSEGDAWMRKAERVTIPMCFLQSSNDADIRPLLDKLNGSRLRGKHVARTYHDMIHGFCGPRGDRSNPHVAAAVRSALQAAIDFFAMPPARIVGSITVDAD